MYVISAASWVKVQSGETLTFDVKFPVAVIDSSLTSVLLVIVTCITFRSGSKRKTLTAVVWKQC